MKQRLIDADSLKKTLDYYISEAGWSKEIKMALRWVKDEFIDAEPIIEAIPISFIEEQVKLCNEVGFVRGEECYLALIERWREKNDTDRMDNRP